MTAARLISDPEGLELGGRGVESRGVELRGWWSEAGRRSRGEEGLKLLPDGSDSRGAREEEERGRLGS